MTRTPDNVRLLKKADFKTKIIMHFSRGCFKWYFQNIIIPFLFSGNLNISNWPQTWKFSQLLQARKTVVAFDFSRHGHTLVMLSVQFLCSDWSKFTGEFMRKIYAASWILFTLTAEADRVLCQLVMFLTVCFHWMYKMKFSCYQESSVIHG